VNEVLRQLENELGLLDKIVRRTTAKHLNAQDNKNLVKNFAHKYFTELRPVLLGLVGEDNSLVRLDAEIQELLRCAQRRALVTDYRSLMRGARESLADLELKAISSRNRPNTLAFVDPKCQRILDILEKVCPSAAQSYEQGFRDLADKSRRSWRGTAVEFREAVRELLDTLAPDDEVTSQKGFKQEPDTNGPTMKQKAVFILRKRRPRDPQVKAFANAVDVVEETIGKFVRSVYTRSSTAVHISDSIDEARKIRDYVTLVLAELLEIRE